MFIRMCFSTQRNNLDSSTGLRRTLKAGKSLVVSMLLALTLSPLNILYGQSGSDLLLTDTVPLLKQIPAGNSPPAAQLKSKSLRVGSALSQLEGRFLNNELLAQDASVASGNRVVIEAIASGSGAELLEALTGVGLEKGAVFGKFVSGTLPLTAISAAESLSALKFIELSRPFTRVGAATSQADIAMQSDLARSTFGIDGDGVTIGILSDSYNLLGGEAADITSGDLPNDVIILDDTAAPPIVDEGRAMAQLIHDIVPGADLIFHTAFNGVADFAQGILELRDAGADIIVDDVGYFAEPFFQDGVVAQAVDQVVADGAVYFSAAGNAADNSYESAYTDSGLGTIDFDLSGTPFELMNLHDFDPDPSAVDTAQQFLVAPGEQILLSVQWDQPFASAGGSGSVSDIDVFLYDSSGNFLDGGTSNNLGNDAVELVFYENTSEVDETVLLVVGVFDGPVPNRIKWVNFANLVPHSFATFSSTVFGHPNAEGAIAVGAAQYDQTPAFGQTPPIIEFFSAHGGTEILFDTAGTSLEAPVDRNKPEIVAPDGTDTTFFGTGDFDNSGFPDFFGTSAAAPHAAAVAALQLECDSLLMPSDIQANQTSTAIDMGSIGFDNITGAGLIDALAAVGSCSPPTAAETCNGLTVTVNLNFGETPGPGDDVILGTPGNDEIRGLAGNDTICGMGGDDFLQGDSGDDWIDGGDGIDSIRGGLGNDVLLSGSGATVGTTSLVFGGDGEDTITGGPDADNLLGGEGDDIISGLSGADIINGNRGDDILFGGPGSDTLNGQDGDNDQLFGDAENDILNGGSGDSDFCDGGGQVGDTNSDCEVFDISSSARSNN